MAIMKKFIFVCMLLVSMGLTAQQQRVSIIPEPVSIQVADSGCFQLKNHAVIRVAEAELELASSYLVDYADRYLGISLQQELPVVKGKKKKAASAPTAITLVNLRNGEVDGGYKLTIDAEAGVKIEGNDATGVFYGVQTLIQLLPTRAGVLPMLPLVEIADYPRFSYRGMHLDVVRHFFPVEYIKRYIDFMALHKLNVFHWHLTDDQGWRVEMKCRPELTAQGAFREGEIEGYYPGKYKELPYGGFYTHEQVREVVEYAAQRHIMVIPEVDIPGHCMAVLATYPQFSTTPDEPKKSALTWGIYNRFNNVLAPKPEVFDFLTDVFTELCDLFPAPYIHLGGDECAKKWWKESEQAQQFMRDHQLKDEKELQSHFVHFVQRVIESKGKSAIGWDEVLEGGISKDCVIMNWRRQSHGVRALEAGNRVIFACSGWLYLNKKETRLQTEIGPNGPVSMEKVYNFEVVPDTVPAELLPRVMGVQGCLWTEYVQSPWKAEFSIFPRLSALAENAWSVQSVKSWEKFLRKITTQFDRYELWGARYNDAILRQNDVERKR